MPAIVIEVPEDIANRLAAAGVLPEEARRFALHRLGLLAERMQAEAERAAECEEWGECLDRDDESLELTEESLISSAKLQIVLKPLIERICQRPRMFVRYGTFSEASDLLSGYAAGFHAVSGLPGPDGLVAFRTWLADRFWKSHHFPRNLVWWAYIGHFGADDAERFQLLQKLYEEFLQREIISLQESAG